jgi:BlaI family penicillinase repressor
MSTPSIPESEWAVMEILWDASPQTASEVAKTLSQSKGWAENTVRTLLTRLVEKGILEIVEKAGSPRLFAPAVKREALVQVESQTFLERIFQGAAKPLLVHFASNARLTSEEVRELKSLLDQSIEKTNPENPLS